MAGASEKLKTVLNIPEDITSVQLGKDFFFLCCCLGVEGIENLRKSQKCYHKHNESYLLNTIITRHCASPVHTLLLILTKSHEALLSVLLAGKARTIG